MNAPKNTIATLALDLEGALFARDMEIASMSPEAAAALPLSTFATDLEVVLWGHLIAVLEELRESQANELQ